MTIVDSIHILTRLRRIQTTTPAEKKAVPQRKVVKAGADDEE